MHTAVEIMQQVHKEGVNNKETMKIGESLLPSMEHLKRCLKERTSLPPHFQHLTSSDIYDSDKVEDELQKLRKKASNLFFDIGKRLLEGRTWPVWLVFRSASSQPMSEHLSERLTLRF